MLGGRKIDLKLRLRRQVAPGGGRETTPSRKAQKWVRGRHVEGPSSYIRRVRSAFKFRVIDRANLKLARATRNGASSSPPFAHVLLSGPAA